MLEITTMNKGPIPPELCDDRRQFLVGFGRTPSVDRLVRAEKRGGTIVVDDGDFFTTTAMPLPIGSRSKLRSSSHDARRQSRRAD